MNPRNGIKELSHPQLEELGELIKDFFKEKNPQLFTLYFTGRTDRAIHHIHYLYNGTSDHVIEKEQEVKKFINDNPELLFLLKLHLVLKNMSENFNEETFKAFAQTWEDYDPHFIHEIETASHFPDTATNGFFDNILKRILSINIKLSAEEILTIKQLWELAEPKNYSVFVKLMLRLQEGEVLKINDEGKLVELLDDGEVIKGLASERIPDILAIVRLERQLNSLSLNVFQIISYSLASKSPTFGIGSMVADQLIPLYMELMKNNTQIFDRLKSRISDLNNMLENILGASGAAYALSSLEVAITALENNQSSNVENDRSLKKLAKASSDISVIDLVGSGKQFAGNIKDSTARSKIEDTVKAFDTSRDEKKLFHMIKPHYRDIRTILHACEEYKKSFSIAAAEYEVLSRLIDILKLHELQPKRAFEDFVREFNDNYFLLKKYTEASKRFFTCLKTTEVVNIVKAKQCLKASEEYKDALKTNIYTYLKKQKKTHGITFDMYENRPDPEYFTKRGQENRTTGIFRTTDALLDMAEDVRNKNSSMQKFAKENPEFKIYLEQYQSAHKLIVTLQEKERTPKEKIRNFKREFREQLPTFKKSDDNIGVKFLKLIGNIIPAVLKLIDKTTGERFIEHSSKIFKKNSLEKPQQIDTSRAKKTYK